MYVPEIGLLMVQVPLPAARVELAQVGAVPEGGVMVQVIVPVGVGSPDGGVTVAVNVTVEPGMNGDGLATTATVGLAFATLSVLVVVAPV